MSSNGNNSAPLGGIFAVLGAFVGFGYGAYLSDGAWVAALIMAVIGAVIGNVVEHIVARLFIVGLLVVGFVIRHQIYHAILS